MTKEVENFNRQELFNHFNSGENPFLILTTKIDVTSVVDYCKIHKNFYPTMGYIITKTVNDIENFKYRYKDNKIYYCDVINSNYTQMIGEDIGFFDVPYTDDYNKYIESFLDIQSKFINGEYNLFENVLDEIWLSCAPWFSFTGLIPPYNKENSIPQFIWDKYELVNGKYYINLMIMIHHGFADGSHIAKFIKLLNENIQKF